MDQETNSVEEVLYGIRDYVVIGSAVELDRPAVARRNRKIAGVRTVGLSNERAWRDH
jgi:hypothetical protein